MDPDQTGPLEACLHEKKLVRCALEYNQQM